MQFINEEQEFRKIIEMVNQSVADACPELPPLNHDNILVLPDEEFIRTVGDSTRASLHPFFRDVIEKRAAASGMSVRYVPEGSETWFNPDSGNYFFAGHNLEDLRSDKMLGYLGIGLNLCHAALWLSAAGSLVEGEEAERYGKRMIFRLDEEGFVGRAITPEDKENMLALMREKVSCVAVRGTTNRIVVENLYFSSQFGTVAEKAVTANLTRPVKERYVDLMVDELRIPVSHRAVIKNRIRNFGTIVIPREEVPRYEAAVLRDLDRLGFRGRTALLEGYKSSEIAKSIVLDYAGKPR